MNEPKSLWQPVDDEARRLGKTLLRTARHAALAVIEPEDGAPSVSRVNVATAMYGTMGFLASQLSPHFSALEANNRCSLLLGEPGKGDPLAHPRITIIGQAQRLPQGPERTAFRRRFLWRHPKSALYADFGDMAFWQMSVDRVLLNGGYGKAFAPEPSGLLTDMTGIEDLEDAEEGAVNHMNEDHGDAIDHYANGLLGREKQGWQLIGLDPEGLDLMRHEETARLWYDEPLKSSGDLRAKLVELACR